MEKKPEFPLLHLLFLLPDTGLERFIVANCDAITGLLNHKESLMVSRRSTAGATIFSTKHPQRLVSPSRVLSNRLRIKAFSAR